MVGRAEWLPVTVSEGESDPTARVQAARPRCIGRRRHECPAPFRNLRRPL